MKTYVHWTAISGINKYYLYRFLGTIEEALASYDEFYYPNGICISDPIDPYLGSTEHWTLVSTIDVPERAWESLTYYIDDIESGQYVYVVRGATDVCVGIVSDPIPIIVQSRGGCTEDLGYRYDAFKIEGQYLNEGINFVREFGYKVKPMDINIECTYTSSSTTHTPLLLFVYGDDESNGQYIYISEDISNVFEELNIEFSNKLFISTISYSDWRLLYESEVIVYEAPEPDAILHIDNISSVDVRIRTSIDIDSISIWNGVIPNIVIDSKFSEGMVYSSEGIINRIYPFSGKLRNIDFEFVKPSTIDSIFELLSNGEMYTIIVPANSRSYSYTLSDDEAISIVDTSYFSININQCNGVSLNIHWGIEVGEISKICIPYECISYQSLFFEGQMLSSVNSDVKATMQSKGKIIRAYVDTRYASESEPGSIGNSLRIANMTTGTYRDVFVQNGLRNALECIDLTYDNGDVISISTPSNGNLISVNVRLELWTCGYDIMSTAMTVDGEKFIDGWFFPNGMSKANAYRQMSYPFVTYIHDLRVEHEDGTVFPDDMTISFYVDNNLIFSSLLGSYMDIPVNLYVGKDKCISVGITSESPSVAVNVSYTFTAINPIDIVYFDSDSAIIDRCTLAVSTICQKEYLFDGIIGKVIAQTYMPAISDIKITISNLTSGESIVLSTIGVGESICINNTPLYFSQDDLILIVSDLADLNNIINIELSIYNKDSISYINSKNLKLISFATNKRVGSGRSTVWLRTIEKKSILTRIVVSAVSPSAGGAFTIKINSTNYDYYFAPYTTTKGEYHIYDVNLDIEAGDTLEFVLRGNNERYNVNLILCQL